MIQKSGFGAAETRFLNLFQYTFVELPKFTKKENEIQSIAEKWMYFLKHAKELKVVPEVIQEEAIKEAFAVVDRINWSKEELEAYERRTMARRDEYARLEYSYTKGHEKGLVEGQKNAMRDIVSRMLRLGVSIEKESSTFHSS